MRKILIHLVDDEEIIHDIFNRIFKGEEYHLIISASKKQAIEQHSKDVDVVIMDLMIPGSSGIDIFKALKERDPGIKAIFLTAYGTIESAIETIKLGALDYLQKPFNNLEIKHKIHRIVKENKTKKENIELKKLLNQRFSFENIIGHSGALRKTLELVESVAPTNSTVLITGESGTGKELIAKAIYKNSQRSHKGFFSINASNIPENLFESMLFGYKKGAFTGAQENKKGLFEEADGATIFLDEIANLSWETQNKILRVLQEKEIQPLGSNKTQKVDVRIIAATNANLREKVEAKEFKEDLFYRLNIINIELPPLRNRKEDITDLCSYFMDKFSKENNKKVKSFSPQFMEKILDYDWPGNIRELENTIHRAVILSSKETLEEELLPIEIKEGRYSIKIQKGLFNEQVNNYKRELITKALMECNGVQKGAAELLGLKTTTLYELMKRLNVKKNI